MGTKSLNNNICTLLIRRTGRKKHLHWLDFFLSLDNLLQKNSHTCSGPALAGKIGKGIGEVYLKDSSIVSLTRRPPSDRYAHYWIGWGRLVDSEMMQGKKHSTLGVSIFRSSLWSSARLRKMKKLLGIRTFKRKTGGLIASRRIPGIPCLPILGKKKDPAESESYSLILIRGPPVGDSKRLGHFFLRRPSFFRRIGTSISTNGMDSKSA